MVEGGTPPPHACVLPAEWLRQLRRQAAAGRSKAEIPEQRDSQAPSSPLRGRADARDRARGRSALLCAAAPRGRRQGRSTAPPSPAAGRAPAGAALAPPLGAPLSPHRFHDAPLRRAAASGRPGPAAAAPRPRPHRPPRPVPARRPEARGGTEGRAAVGAGGGRERARLPLQVF